MSESWKLVYEGYDPEQEMLREALCTLGNGYFATRGAGEETDAVDDVRYPGTYLAGGYNRLETPVADRMIVNEDLVNFPNWLCLSFRPSGGDWFSLDEGEVLSYRQELDLLSGVLSRDLLHRDTEGRETRVETRRLVHMRHMHLAALEMTITPQNWSGKTEIRSAVDGSVINSGVARYRQLNSVHLEPLGTEQVTDDTVLLKTRTTQSEISMGMAARTRVTIDGKDVVAARETDSRDDYVSQTCTVAAEQGTALVVDKVVALFTSRDRALSDTGRAATYEVARAGSFSALVKSHVLAWKQLWRRGDIVLEPSDGAQMIVRLHIFHLLQTFPPIPSTWTSACRPVVGTEKRTGDTSFGMRSISSRTSTSAFRRSPGRCCFTVTDVLTKLVTAPGTQGIGAPCIPGKAAAAEGKRPRLCT